MLIDCPECGQNVSDKAPSCPHCGFPLMKTTKPSPKPPKRMRLPNGFGRITKLSGRNLRKPFRVMVSVGKDENGRPIGKLLKPTAYFSTYNEAYAALIEYNKSPYDITNTITMDELFQKWFAKHKETIVPKRAVDMNRAWGYCSQIHDIDVANIRTRTIRDLLDSIDKPDSVKATIKSVLSMMLDYAVEYEYVSRNVVKDLKTKQTRGEKSQAHHIFTDEEFAKIVLHKNEYPYDIIYIQSYTGMRPGEVCSIETGKINMKEWYLVGGSKTEAGRDRMIPIHEKIRPIIQQKYNEAVAKGSRFLFGSKVNEALRYNAYNQRFKSIFPNHKPHDPRKHFITMAKKAGVDEYALKRIVGHAISDLTESIYTERDIAWLHKEISKIQ